MALDIQRVGSLPQRPGSNSSHRSVSRTSQRPFSRLSQRGKHPRLTGLLDKLVKQVTGLTSENDSEVFQEVVDAVSKLLDQAKQATSPDMTKVDAQFIGHIRKARIHSQDTIADLFQRKYTELKFNVVQHKDLDDEIKLSMLPHHLQFLLLLSSPPTPATFSLAETISRQDERPPTDTALWTWKKILEEEPFEGQHWQGALGFSDSSSVGSLDGESDDNRVLSLLGTPFSPENSALSAEDVSSRFIPRKEIQKIPTVISSKFYSRELVENLQANQYWRNGRHMIADPRLFDIRDPSTLGPALDGILSHDAAVFSGATHELCIREVDAVREVLIALQGHRSCLFEIYSDENKHSVRTLHDCRISHFTRTSQASLLNVFASYVSTLNPLRALVRRTWDHVAMLPCHTFEAFTAAIARQLTLFDHWCCVQEGHLYLSQGEEPAFTLVISLLSLHNEVRKRLGGTFQTLLRIVRSVERNKSRLASPELSASILNSLLNAVRQHSAIGDDVTALCLMEVWRESVEPLWSNVGRWLKDGIPIRAGLDGEVYITHPTWDEKEFFIRINRLADIGSPDFWEDGFTLLSDNPASTSSDAQDADDEGAIPTFLRCVVGEVLAAGKAIGYLRALNMMCLVGNDWLDGWPKFWKLTEAPMLRSLEEMLKALISDLIIPRCLHVQICFSRVLVKDCNLWLHIKNLENVYFMMKGDAMSQFSQKVFTKMDTRQPWNDFHFLNSAFREVAEHGSTSWIDPSLVRISHHKTKDRNVGRTVRAIDGISVEYAFPFPLTYLFGVNTNASYSSIFTFLLQIRRAKYVLDRILIRGLNRSMLNQDIVDVRAFYILRSKLSWFINILMSFIMTNVIHTGLKEFHGSLRNACSLDEMISVHRSHLERLLCRCLLHDSASALHRAILSILDIGLHLSDCLAAFAGDTSLDISRRSLVVMRRRHRNHNRRPDVIGFAADLNLSDDDTEEEGDDRDESVEPSLSASATFISFAEESFHTRLEKMNGELDALLRFVRHGVESLASGPAGPHGDTSTTFGILAFALLPTL